MALSKSGNYFISKTSVVLRKTASPKGTALNHLIFGDWLRWRGETKGAWQKVRCRGNEGWIKTSEFNNQRILEINFVDIGQGDGAHIVTPEDKVIVIDAGKTENMFRFLSWRYNLHNRKVAGVDGVKASDSGARKPFNIEQAVISHPDLDHYYGFRNLFAHPKLKFGTVFHNGIVERPVSKAEKNSVKGKKNIKYFSDLGLAVKGDNGKFYLLDVVNSNKAMRDLVKAHPKTSKKYLSTMRAAVDNPANKGLKFKALSANDKHLPGFDGTGQVTIDILGPVTEKVTHGGKNHKALRKIGNEGVTKNGHSVVFQLKIGKLKVMLGGDLNTESEDYLLRHYCGINEDTSHLESVVYELRAKGDDLTEDEKGELQVAESSLAAIVSKGRQTFQVDVAKACHHGSHHFSETFLKAINAIAVVISSGDAEAYSHPRPDALGAFGKYGRGHRPLLFSTEIARSTREFTPVFKFYERIKKFEADLKSAQSKREKARLQKEIEQEKSRNVAVYGMITLRTDGDTVIIAQKIEEPSGKDRKWDIQELAFNNARGEFEYKDRTKSH
ncbi:MAG: hypothetical protein HN731_04005 [Rhodospirillaceae bacterium]|nr:hypothetical protein [Rhodospirillaceae bacterium]